LLAHQGHEVYEASDGVTGIALATHVTPEIAIVDIGLPDIDGYDVARRLRTDTRTDTMGLVAMTGYGQRDDKQKAADAGFDEHLTKPVDPAVLLALIAAERAVRARSP
jgi:two-component system CheB/CheR fusion protein